MGYIACQVPLSMGFPRQAYWSGLPFPLPGNIPYPQVVSSCVCCTGRWILYQAVSPEKPLNSSHKVCILFFLFPWLKSLLGFSAIDFSTEEALLKLLQVLTMTLLTFSPHNSPFRGLSCTLKRLAAPVASTQEMTIALPLSCDRHIWQSWPWWRATDADYTKDRKVVGSYSV